MKKTTIDFTPVFHLVSQAHGSTVALAKKLLSKEDFEDYLNESEIQTRHTMLEFIESFPHIIDEKEELALSLNASIETLKKKRT